MPNQRNYFAVQAVFIKPDGTSDPYEAVKGVQSASDNTAIETENIQEMGQLQIYESIEGSPTVTVDMERVLDGCVPAYLLATEGSSTASLAGRQAKQSVVAFGLYDDTADYASGATVTTLEHSGMDVNSVSFSFGIDGAFTESLSLVGNNRVWSPGGSEQWGTIPADPFSAGLHEPCALTTCSGGVQFKEDLMYGGITYPTLLPTQIPGVSTSGTNDPDADGCPEVPVQSIEVSVDLNREEIFELGKKSVYKRFAQFPVTVTTTIEILSKSGDYLDITEEGAVFDGCEYQNAQNQTIRLATRGGLHIDLGTRNKLTDISFNMGDTGGGNASYTLTYENNNIMSVFHVNDPSGIVYSGVA